MILSGTLAPMQAGSRRLVATGAIALASLGAVYALHTMEEYAAYLAAYVAIIALTFWRPRYGLYAVVLLYLGFESQPADPLMFPGLLTQSNISSLSPLGFVNFTPMELLLLITTLLVLAGALLEGRGLRPAQLWGPLLAFLGLLLLSLAWGAGRGGSLNIALWETRALFFMALVAMLVPAVLRRREHVEHLVNLICLAVVLLSVEIIWRRFTVLDSVAGRQLDNAFAHETPVFMNLVVILLLARLIWPASRRQRLAALAIPLILYAEMVTERRAGWISLDVGLLLLAIFIFRLRRRVFYFAVLPLVLVYSGYVAAFWNAQGTLAQPARAVRSISNPDSRDQSSNVYRFLETADIRLNIHAHPVTGLGFGQGYTFYVPLPDLSWWPFWHYIAHNAVLWLWMNMGPLGFFSFLVLIGAGIVRGVQLLKRAANDCSAPVIVALVSAVLMVLVFCYVDVGMTNERIATVLGLALGVIGLWGREAATAENNR